MIVSCHLCNTTGKQNHVSPLTKKNKPKWLRNVSLHKKELACFWTPTVLDSLCYFCAGVLHTVFSYALTPRFPQSLLWTTQIAAAEITIFPPSFVPRPTPSEVLDGLQQRSIRKLLWTKAAFSGTSPPRSHLPQSCTRPAPAQWASKQRAFLEYLWEKLSHRQTEHFLQ